jgi:hypothetical protein
VTQAEAAASNPGLRSCASARALGILPKKTAAERYNSAAAFYLIYPVKLVDQALPFLHVQIGILPIKRVMPSEKCKQGSK